MRAARRRVGTYRGQPCAQRRRIRRIRLQRALGFHQPQAKTLAQFLCGAIGKRGDENLFDAQAAFEEQPQKNQADRVRLAGAGARFDEHAAGERHGRPVQRRQSARFMRGAHPRRARVRCGSRMPAIHAFIATNSSWCGADRREERPIACDQRGVTRLVMRLALLIRSVAFPRFARRGVAFVVDALTRPTPFWERTAAADRAARRMRRVRAIRCGVRRRPARRWPRTTAPARRLAPRHSSNCARLRCRQPQRGPVDVERQQVAEVRGALRFRVQQMHRCVRALVPWVDDAEQAQFAQMQINVSAGARRIFAEHIPHRIERRLHAVRSRA